LHGGGAGQAGGSQKGKTEFHQIGFLFSRGKTPASRRHFGGIKRAAS
jgi:hypothetical protein